MHPQEERLSRYIDDLNAEKEPDRHGSADPTEDRLFAAVRAVKGLRESAWPEQDFARSLAADATRRSAVGRRSSVRSRWAAWISAAAAAVVLVATAVTLPGARVNAAEIASRAEKAAKDPAVSGIAGYTGVFTSSTKGELEIAYLAPDKLLVKERATGRQQGTNGTTTWSYDPARSAAVVTENAPAPLGLSLLPSEVRFERFLKELTANRQLSLAKKSDTVAGRKAYVLRFFPRTGDDVAPDLFVRVDYETYVVLKTEQRAQDGTSLGTAGFVSLQLGQPSATLFQPAFPPGTAVTRQTHADLAALLQRSGLSIRLPHPLPVEWIPMQPELTADTGRTRLNWFYQANGKTVLSVLAAKSVPETPESGETVPLRPDLKGVFYKNDLTGWPGLHWTAGDTFYRIEGPGLAKDLLVGLARSIMN